LREPPRLAECGEPGAEAGGGAFIGRSRSWRGGDGPSASGVGDQPGPTCLIGDTPTVSLPLARTTGERLIC
jgi:hypothetical protein